MSRQVLRAGRLMTGVGYDVVVTEAERSRLQAAAKRARCSKGELLAKMLELWESNERRVAEYRTGGAA